MDWNTAGMEGQFDYLEDPQDFRACNDLLKRHKITGPRMKKRGKNGRWNG